MSGSTKGKIAFLLAAAVAIAASLGSCGDEISKSVDTYEDAVQRKIDEATGVADLRRGEPQPY